MSNVTLILTKKEAKNIFWSLVNKHIDFYRSEKQANNMFNGKKLSNILVSINDEKIASLELIKKVGAVAEIDCKEITEEALKEAKNVKVIMSKHQ